MKQLTIFFILFTILLTSCEDRTTNVVSLDYYQEYNSQIVEVYKQDHRFDGEAWNKERIFSVSAVRGILAKVAMYHNSGEVAIKDFDGREYYDKDGMVISASKFRVLYPDMEAKFDSLKSQYISIKKYGSMTPY